MPYFLYFLAQGNQFFTNFVCLIGDIIALSFLANLGAWEQELKSITHKDCLTQSIQDEIRLPQRRKMFKKTMYEQGSSEERILDRGIPKAANEPWSAHTVQRSDRACNGTLEPSENRDKNRLGGTNFSWPLKYVLQTCSPEIAYMAIYMVSAWLA